MLLLGLCALVLVAVLAVGWRVLAQESSPRAANAVLVMLLVGGAVVWLLSNASFDAGV